MYFLTKYGWSLVVLVDFVGEIWGGSLPYIRYGGMSITTVLLSPAVSFEGKYSPLLIHTSQVPHNSSICFVPLIDVAGFGSSMYFI